MSAERLSVYDGRQILAVIEERKDGWHVSIRDRHIGICADRKSALHLVTITLNPPAVS
jgi:hypothetical protein